MAGRVGGGEQGQLECQLKMRTGFIPGPGGNLGVTFCLSSIAYYLFHVPFIVKTLPTGAFTNKNNKNWPHSPTPNIHIKTSVGVQPSDLQLRTLRWKKSITIKMLGTSKLLKNHLESCD